jgi:hypothetical protein
VGSPSNREFLVANIHKFVEPRTGKATKEADEFSALLTNLTESDVKIGCVIIDEVPPADSKSKSFMLIAIRMRCAGSPLQRSAVLQSCGAIPSSEVLSDHGHTLPN